MQNCFRQYPEVYGSEIDSDADDEDDVGADLATPSDSSSPDPSRSSLSTPDISSDAQASPPSSQLNDPNHTRSAQGKLSGEPSSTPRSPAANKRELDLVPENYKPSDDDQKPSGSSDTQRAQQASQQVKRQEAVSESESLVPRAAFDAGNENAKVGGRK